MKGFTNAQSSSGTDKAYVDATYKDDVLTLTRENGEKTELDIIECGCATMYGARIAVTSADPNARVTYPKKLFNKVNGAYNKKPCTNTENTFDIGGWKDCALISGIKRQMCIITTVSSETTSGSNIKKVTWTDVADKRAATAGTADSEVYTYFPTWYFKMEHVTEDNVEYIDFAFSQEKIDDTWADYAGSVGSDRRGYFHLGCFCSPSSSAVLSYGGTKSATISLTNAITYTQTNKGTGWDIMTWYQWNYIAALMTLMFKTTDLQAALGNGISGGSQSTQTALTYTNDYGMYGDTSGTTTQVAFFWLQNIYGDYYQWCGGAKTSDSRVLLCQTGYSSTTESDFDVNTGKGPSANLTGGAISKVSGTTNSGFFPMEISGSYTTYFADVGFVYASYFPFVGGYYDYGTFCGPFYANFRSSASDARAVRPSYRG